MAAYRETFNAMAKSPVSAPQLHSPWHSPVPYLFGGLAAMLGLIALALLILACSYWKLSGYLDGGDEAAGRDLEAGEGKIDETQKAPPAYEEKILVIMAGQEKPTFLATPMWSSRSCPFDDNSSSSSSSSSSSRRSTCTCDKSDKSVEMAETVKQGSGGHDLVQSRDRENPDTSTD